VPPAPRSARQLTILGLFFALGAYGLWGFLPLYFRVLQPAGAIEIVSWRILLSLVFCVVLLTVTRGWRALMVILRDRRTVLIMGVAGVFILVNWLVYVFATVTDRVIEASLGYFTNPIVTVLLGVIVLRERLRPLQWIAVSISAIAVIVLAVNYGQFPWIALALAFSFGLYGFIKKSVGGRVDALSGLTIETAWLAPLALATVVFLAVNGTLVAGSRDAIHTTLILSAGVVTAIPLLLFAAAARRLPLSYIGMAQYITPVMQFLIGVFIFHESMPPVRWLGFALVWVALVVLTIDMLHNSRAARRAVIEPI
jgi:chloramphenicol-sensitive protein RarD